MLSGTRRVSQRGLASLAPSARRSSRNAVKQVSAHGVVKIQQGSVSQRLVVSGFENVSAPLKKSYHSTVPCYYVPNPWDGVEKEVLSMPALSPSMTTGNIAAWNKKEGDKISAGDSIAEIETDKATVAFEATEDGFLAKILMPSGSRDIPVSTPVAIIVPKKDMVAKFADFKVENLSGGCGSAAPSKPVEQSNSKTSSASSTPAAAPASPKPSVPHSILPMPSLSPTMEDGIIASWKKKEGDKISAGDVMAEIETDKATVAFEATEDGFLAKILVPASGNRVKVNDPVAIVVDKKSDIDAVKDYVPGKPGASSSAPAKQPEQQAAQQQQSTQRQQSSAPKASGDRLFVSPYAKLLAKEKSVDLNQVGEGSGPNGRIIAHDVLKFQPRAAQQQSGKSAASSTAGGKSVAYAEYEDMAVSNIRRVTAERLSQSKQTIPHYYLTMECQIDEFLEVRKMLNEAGKGEYKLSVNDFVVKASALALKAVPQANSEWRGDVIRRYLNVDINVAVNTDAGLLTPIIRDADAKGLAAIAGDVKSMAAKAKENKLALADLQPGTFTISNLGMFGISQFAAVINPPQACILAVGASEARVVPNPKAATVQTESPFVVRNILTVTLSCDHRVVDGAIGAKWLQSFKDYMENPMKMLL